MTDYSYTAVKARPKTFLAMTGLTVKEFDQLLFHFDKAYSLQRVAEGKKADEKRGVSGKLSTIEDKLFFLMFYLKTYPLQEVIAYSFGLSQGKANHWIHRLSVILKAALADSGHRPARLPEELLARLEAETAQAVGIDGTERRRQRPLDDDAQRECYSGKKSPYHEK
jgi:hypothetical protein